MNLKEGKNELRYVIEGKDDKVFCVAHIFLYKSSTKLVISDIDGTITKSDVRGHVMNMLGRDWTHENVCELFTHIAKNGYQILYLTARAIGQSDTTKNYLRKLKQNGFSLPDGPVLTSPDRLYHSFKREVIRRKPDEFKIDVLSDIKRLFGKDNKQPYIAGFGNRPTVTIDNRRTLNRIWQ